MWDVRPRAKRPFLALPESSDNPDTLMRTRPLEEPGVVEG